MGSRVLIIVLVIVNEIRLKAGGPELAPADAVRLINNGATVLDVRPAEQYANGHIVGARSVPLGELSGKLDGLAKKMDRPLLVYCELGNQSAKAAATLRQAGFSQVLHLKGGVVAWQRDNLPLATGKKPQKA